MYIHTVSSISFRCLAVAICLVCTVVAQAQLPEPVSFWRFEEGSGGTTADIGTGGHPGILVGNVAFVDDPERGTVLEFGPGRSYVETNAWITELGTADFSIAAWIQTREEGAAIVGKTDGDRDWDFHEKQFYLSAGSEQGQPVAGGVHFYGNQAGEIWGETAVNNGVWHHVCVTWDNDTDEQHIYVDGELDDLRPVWVYYGGRGDNADDHVRIGFDGSGAALADFTGLMDDVAIFDVTLTPEQVVELMNLAWPATASNPRPFDGRTDLPPEEVVFGWTPGMYAGSHDVYFGTDFAAVSDASRADPRNVLVSQGQTQDFYPTNGALDLDFATTYYWRVDEVNAPPSSAIYKGETWTFTTELIAYPISGDEISVTASSFAENQGPENTINSSGLTGDLHSGAPATMWLTAPGAAGPAWIEYEFDRVHKLVEMRAWNQNGPLEPAIGFGCKEVVIEYSIDGVDYATVGATHEFARAPGKPDYAYNTTIDLGGVAAKYVRLTINSNWGGILPQYGLSEVQFLSIPLFAREPDPTPGEGDASVDVTLQWRPGRGAVTHDVYLSADQQAVVDGVALVGTVETPSYTPTLDLATTYYWRVDEVNEAQTPSAWQGSLWSFSTADHVVVDDFEGYGDDLDAGNAIFQTWVDGWEVPANGSIVGKDTSEGGTFGERAIVHDGGQSMPMAYDNTGSATYSEATRTFDSPQDWTQHGIGWLTLWFYGDPTNEAQQMYVKINGVKVPYNSSVENLKLDEWQRWNIDLSSLSVSNVSTLTIGFERIGAAGGQGAVLIDDVLLYSDIGQ